MDNFYFFGYERELHVTNNVDCKKWINILPYNRGLLNLASTIQSNSPDIETIKVKRWYTALAEHHYLKRFMSYLEYPGRISPNEHEVHCTRASSETKLQLIKFKFYDYKSLQGAVNSEQNDDNYIRSLALWVDRLTKNTGIDLSGIGNAVDQVMNNIYRAFDTEYKPSIAEDPNLSYYADLVHGFNGMRRIFSNLNSSATSSQDAKNRFVTGNVRNLELWVRTSLRMMLYEAVPSSFNSYITYIYPNGMTTDQLCDYVERLCTCSIDVSLLTAIAFNSIIGSDNTLSLWKLVCGDFKVQDLTLSHEMVLILKALASQDISIISTNPNMATAKGIKNVNEGYRFILDDSENMKQIAERNIDMILNKSIRVNDNTSLFILYSKNVREPQVQTKVYSYFPIRNNSKRIVVKKNALVDVNLSRLILQMDEIIVESLSRPSDINHRDWNAILLSKYPSYVMSDALLQAYNSYENVINWIRGGNENI